MSDSRLISIRLPSGWSHLPRGCPNHTSCGQLFQAFASLNPTCPGNLEEIWMPFFRVLPAKRSRPWIFFTKWILFQQMHKIICYCDYLVVLPTSVCLTGWKMFRSSYEDKLGLR